MERPVKERLFKCEVAVNELPRHSMHSPFTYMGKSR